MKHLLITICALVALVFVVTAAEEPPAQPLGQKGKLVLSDDFSTDRFGTVWSEHIATAGGENGGMVGGEPGAAHGSVPLPRLDLHDGNLICECKVQWEHNATVAF